MGQMLRSERPDLTAPWGEATADAIWERVQERIEPGFRSGMREAYTAAMDLGIQRFRHDAQEAVAFRTPPLPEDIQVVAGRAVLAGTVFDVQHPRAVRWIDEQAATMVKGVDDTTRDIIREIIGDSRTKGLSSQGTARAIEQRFPYMAEGAPQRHIQSRAHLIAVTEISRAYEQGQKQAISVITDAGLHVVKGWLTVGDAAVDDVCSFNEVQGEIMSGEVFGSGDGEPPAHPACVIGSTTVAGPPVIAVTSRRWEGEVVVIHVAGRDDLTITPNHPVLTDHGWVPAGLIEVGDYVVCGALIEGEATGVQPNDAQRPAPIAEVARAAQESLSMTSVSVPPSPEHFHGDGEGSEVHVVWPDGSLRPGYHAPLGEHPQEVLLHRGRTPDPLLGLGPSTAFLDRGDPSQIGLMSGGGIGAALLGGALGDHQAVGVAVPTPSDAMLAQDAANDVSRDAVLLRQSVLRYAGGIATNEVIGVRRVPFAGHVYNLQTEGGWYTANGIVTHNCRCTAIYRTLSSQEVADRGLA